jgi:hypothetical protein
MSLAPIPIDPGWPTVAPGTHTRPPGERPMVARLNIGGWFGSNVTITAHGQSHLLLGLYGPNPAGELHGPTNGRAGNPPRGAPPTMTPRLQLNLRPGTYYLVVFDATGSRGPEAPYSLNVAVGFWRPF